MKTSELHSGLVWLINSKKAYVSHITSVDLYIQSSLMVPS